MFHQVCNGEKDCLDESDESVCISSNWVTSSTTDKNEHPQNGTSITIYYVLGVGRAARQARTRRGVGNTIGNAAITLYRTKQNLDFFPDLNPLNKKPLPPFSLFLV